MKKFLACLSLLCFLFGCEQLSKETDEPDEFAFQARTIGLVAKDVNKSVDWYVEHLGFERDTVMHFEFSGITVGMIHMGDFFLELIQFDNTYGKEELGLNSSELNGIIKLGLKTKNIDRLYADLAERPIDIIAPLDFLPDLKEGYPWPEKYFLIKDPDGNYLQFFSSHDKDQTEELEPFLSMLGVDDIHQAIEWYEQNLHFELVSRTSYDTNNRAIMEKDGFMLELGELDGYVSFESLENLDEEISKNKVRGFYKISLLADNIHPWYDQFKAQNRAFDFDLTERKSMAGDRFFMVKDDFGNSLQFFEVDQ